MMRRGVSNGPQEKASVFPRLQDGGVRDGRSARLRRSARRTFRSAAWLVGPIRLIGLPTYRTHVAIAAVHASVVAAHCPAFPARLASAEPVEDRHDRRAGNVR